MGSIQLNYYSNVSTSIIDMQNTLDGNFIGHHRVSLTNYDNTSLPAIAIGSIVENNGALFKFTTETAISGTPVDGVNYILLVPSGDPALGTATVTPTWSQTAPTWSDSKQGWYGTGGSANYRYLEFFLTKSSSTWYKKEIKNLTRGVNLISSNITTPQTLTANSVTYSTIIFNTKRFDFNSQYSTVTGVLTVSQSGYYNINYNIQIETSLSNAIRRFSIRSDIFLNNTTTISRKYNTQTSAALTTATKQYMTTNDCILYFLNVGDTIEIKVRYVVLDNANAAVSENGTVNGGSTDGNSELTIFKLL